ncbi:MAG TPA: fumarylacetoacetate hydrolase family protein [Aestuariivirgaceae bacterium]|nr:fumarylacetoacetate hydrolase family protein [Aestuariivirgaceae bacterium]
MKLLRYGPAGQEKPGILDSQGQIRDLSGVVDDITPDAITPDGQARLKRTNVDDLPAVSGSPRLGVPLAGIGNFIAIGLNYTDHAKETGAAAPAEPIIFSKHLSCLSGPNDDVVVPKDSKKSDWEVELGFVIGTRTKNVSESDALKHVAGYCLVNDVSEREYQIERHGQWIKGKSLDTFGPVGPWLVTADEIPDPQVLSIWLELNGKRVQDGTTKNMIFGIAFLVSYLSKFMTLVPGDLVCTGTPHGVGLGMKPPTFLKEGDKMHLGIDGLGEQRQTVVRGN